jgi:hypothetical protein
MVMAIVTDTSNNIDPTKPSRRFTVG